MTRRGNHPGRVMHPTCNSLFGCVRVESFIRSPTWDLLASSTGLDNMDSLEFSLPVLK